MQQKSLKVKANVSDGALFVFLFPSIIHSLCTHIDIFNVIRWLDMLNLVVWSKNLNLERF